MWVSFLECAVIWFLLIIWFGWIKITKSYDWICKKAGWGSLLRMLNHMIRSAKNSVGVSFLECAVWICQPIHFNYSWKCRLPENCRKANSNKGKIWVSIIHSNAKILPKIMLLEFINRHFLLKIRLKVSLLRPKKQYLNDFRTTFKSHRPVEPRFEQK